MTTQTIPPTKPPKQRRKWYSSPLFWTLTMLALFIALIAAVSSTPDQAAAPVPATSPVSPTTVAAPTAEAPTTAAPTTAAPRTTAAAPELTTGQEQAIGAARDYLDTQGFSKAGLIDQLSSPYGSDFSKADATFAVNYLKVDWNEQAVRMAKDYLSTQHFSRSGLIEQLSSPYGSQFTRAQAIYAVNKVGL